MSAMHVPLQLGPPTNLMPSEGDVRSRSLVPFSPSADHFRSTPIDGILSRHVSKASATLQALPRDPGEQTSASRIANGTIIIDQH